MRSDTGFYVSAMVPFALFWGLLFTELLLIVLCFVLFFFHVCTLSYDTPSCSHAAFCSVAVSQFIYASPSWKQSRLFPVRAITVAANPHLSSDFFLAIFVRAFLQNRWNCHCYVAGCAYLVRDTINLPSPKAVRTLPPVVCQSP